MYDYIKDKIYIKFELNLHILSVNYINEITYCIEIAL